MVSKVVAKEQIYVAAIDTVRLVRGGLTSALSGFTLGPKVWPNNVPFVCLGKMPDRVTPFTFVTLLECFYFKIPLFLSLQEN